MFEKIDMTAIKKQLRKLRDVRQVGLLVFVGLILLVTWSGVGIIQTNYDLQKQISGLQQSVQLQQLENSNLKLRNEYFNTDEYLELQARRQFGKAAPGEKLYVVPKAVALSRSVDPLPVRAKAGNEEPDKPFYQRNFEAWMDFLFHRNS
jgi:cell division protein FtsB